MSLRENLQNLVKPREAERAAQREAATKREDVAMVDYLQGKITLEDYREVLKATFQLTKLDLRKLASELNSHH